VSLPLIVITLSTMILILHKKRYIGIPEVVFSLRVQSLCTVELA